MAKRQAEINVISSMAEAKKALSRMEEIQAEIQPLMAEATQLKKMATAYAVEKNIDVIQLDECYYRQINRSNRFWVATPEDMPENAPSKARSLKEIVKGKKVKVKGKMVPLWNLITRRVPDAEAISRAVDSGWISEKEISNAYLEKPQSPFLQRYTGEAD